MEIVLAKSAGFCFGVNRAIEHVYDAIGSGKLYTYGPIIHNKEVTKDLEEKGVYSINLPAYGRENDYGKFLQSGLGAFVEVYDDSVVFTARDFCAGETLENMTYTFELV